MNLNGATDQRLGEAFTAIGGGAIDQLSQFKWWEDSANKKHRASYSDENCYGGDILTDSDEADGWRVKQITYPSCATCSTSRPTAPISRSCSAAPGATTPARCSRT